MNAEISDRERSEVERSAAEARSVVLRSSDIDRYLHPSSDTPFALEYAFYLPGKLQQEQERYTDAEASFQRALSIYSARQHSPQANACSLDSRRC